MPNTLSDVDRPTLLDAIRSKDGRKSLVVRKDNEALTVLKLLQEELDADNNPAVSRQAALKVMIELARHSGQYPPTLWLSNVDRGEWLAAGGFSDVFKGSWKNKPVVLKFPRGKPDLKKRKQFCQEALLWRQLDHRNVLPFLGLYQDEPKQLEAMASPWMRNGNILQYLKNVHNADRYQILINISEGLAYLHGQKPSIIHSDLKPENVLIDDNGIAVLADFGSTRVQHDLTDLRSSTQNSGTVAYMSPELLRSEDGKSTKSSDVWALGMVIYQVFTGERPYLGQGIPIEKVCSSPPTLPRKPTEAAIQIGFSDELWNYLEKGCWAQQERNRPTAHDCRNRLEKLRRRYL